MPRISIIIPCYNQGKYIDEAVDSVLSQTYHSFEIIIVNDGSTDDYTNQILKNYNRPKTRVIHTTNQGLASARNNGIKEATGEYILPLDADDKIGETYLEEAVKILDGDSEIGIVYCRAEFLGEKRGEWILPDYSLNRILFVNMIFCSGFFRKKDWQVVGGYNSNMKYGWEDWDFWLSLLETGKSVYKIPEVLFYYRIKENSMTQSIIKDKISDMYTQVFENHKSFYITNMRNIFKFCIDIYGKLYPYYFANLYIDTGFGYSEEQALIKEIFGSEYQLEFDLSDYSNIKSIRFDPLNREVKLKLNKIQIINDNMSSVVQCESNALYQKGDIFIFDTDDPMIILDIIDIPDPKKVIIELEYISLGTETYKYISEEKSSVIKVRDEEIKQRDEEINQRGEEINQRGEEINQRDEKIKQKDMILENQKRYIEDLLIKEATLNNIYNSYGWKMLARYYKLRDFVLPENSLQKNILKKICGTFVNLKRRLKSADIVLHWDSIDLYYDCIEISGWAISGSGIDRIEIYLDDTLVGKVSYGIPRPDVHKLYPFINSSGNSGFYFFSSLKDIYPLSGRHIIELRGINNKGKVRGVKSSVISKGITNNKITCDKAELCCDCIELSGWAISGCIIDRIEVYMNNTLVGNALYGLARPDVHKAYSLIKNSYNSGFHFFSFLEKFNYRVDNYILSIRAILNNGQYGEVLQPVNLRYNISFLKYIISNVYTPSPDIKSIDTEKPVEIVIPLDDRFNLSNKVLSDILTSSAMPYRLILVDDFISDKRVKEYLKELKKQYHNVHLIDNHEKSGFIKSINKALQYTESHLIILDVSVELPDKWMERLLYPIIKSEKIGVTVPFTDYKSASPFPALFEKNAFFTSDVKNSDKFFQHINPEGNCHEVPVDRVFCVAINRALIEGIGIFNEEDFKRGHEENGWFMKARELGYKNVIVPNLFVSIREDIASQEWESDFLSSPVIKDFILTDPLRYIRDFLIVLITANMEERYVTLVIDHDLGGGANFYRKQFVKNKIEKGESLFLLTYNFFAKYYNLTYFYKDYRIEYKLFNLCELKELCTFIQVKEIFLNNMVSFRDPLEVLSLIKEIKVKYKSKLHIPTHDYFSICPSYVLLNDKEEYCGIPDIEECLRCIKNNNSDFILTKYEDIEHWRKEWGEILEISDKIICFSVSSRNIVQKAYPGLENAKFEIIPHEVDYIQPVSINKTDFSTFNIGILGAISLIKGIKIISDMLEIIEKQNLPVKIIIIGETAEKMEHNNLVITGPYKREEIERLVRKYEIDIFLISSIVPETFSYTTEEIIKMDLPVAVFDIGAHAERVKKYGKGLIIEKIDPAFALESLLNWHKTHGFTLKS